MEGRGRVRGNRLPGRVFAFRVPLVACRPVSSSSPERWWTSHQCHSPIVMHLIMLSWREQISLPFLHEGFKLMKEILVLEHIALVFNPDLK